MIEPYYQRPGVTVYHADCLDVLPQLEQVDAVITDPPYGISGGKGRVNRARGKGNYDASFPDTPEYLIEVVVPIIKSLIRVCPCVVLTPGNRNFMLYPQPDSFGCFYQPASVGLQVFGNADAQPIFYYGKNGTKKNVGKPCSYVLTEHAKDNGHPCPKPPNIWARLLANTTAPESVVLDPFMGSGTTGVACVKTGRRFIGIEIEERYCEIAVKRLAQMSLFEAP